MMDAIQFCQVSNAKTLKITIPKTVAKYRLYVDLVVRINDDTVTMEYPITQIEHKLYSMYVEKIDSVIIQYNLHKRLESKFHRSTLLYYAIEFDKKLNNLIRDKQRYKRVDNAIDFLTLARRLSPFDKQNVQLSLLIKNREFKFEDQPILSEIIINKLMGTVTETIRKGYPELWRIHFKEKKTFTKARSKSESVLRNIAVAHLSNQIKGYLNSSSLALRNNRNQKDDAPLTSDQGNFIYDLLTELGIYRPTKASKHDKAIKDNSYDALRKLIERYC